MIGKTLRLFGIAAILGGLSPVHAQSFPASAIVAKQAEAQHYLAAMNLAQLAYYLERSRFATTIDELNLGVPAETENYRYQIIAAGNELRSIIMTAQAKDSRLKSYSGAVFVFSLGEARTAIAGICGTIRPSTSPPLLPTAPNFVSTGVLCPQGSHALIEFDRRERF